MPCPAAAAMRRIRVRALAASCIAPAVWSMLLLVAVSDCRHFSPPADIQWPPNRTVFHIELRMSVSFTCPNATPILDIYSRFNDTLYDRSWDFHCAHPASSLPEFQPRPWGENHSQLLSGFSHVCPPGSVVSGVASVFHVSHRDRVWQFLCSGVPLGYTYAETCSWTEETGLTEDITLEGDRRLGVIAGVESTKSVILRFDRKWRYLVCSLQRVDCGTPLLANGNASGSTTTFESSVRLSCEPGYYLAGPQTATCTGNGTWTQLPSCVECESIRYCMETVCDGPESLCQRCLPTNPNGLRLALSQNSKKCRVPPVILSPSLLIPFAPGDTLLLPCDAVGNPDPKISWYKEGWPLGLTEHLQQLQNGSLLITNATDSDVGEYDCVAASSVGEDTLNFTLYNTMPPPTVPPAIVNWQQISPHLPGDLVWLHCQATGYPPPVITWTGYSVPIPDQSNSRVMQFSNGTLAFLPAEPEDTGVYTCRAKNTVGDDRQQVVLFVADISDRVSPGEVGYVGETVPAQIILWRDSYAIEVGQSLELECQVTGTPSPTVIWVKDGLEVRTELSGEDWGSWGEGGVADANSSLLIANASIEDEGEYTCIGWNRGGITMRVTTVVVGVVVITPVTPTAFSPPLVESAASPTHHYLLRLFLIVLCTLAVCCT